MATIGSLFLFSNTPQPESQSASIVETIITPVPAKTFVAKPKNIQGSPLYSPTISSATKVEPPSYQGSTLISPSPKSTPIQTPSSSPTLSPEITLTPAPMPSSISTPTSTSSPEQSAKINVNTADKQELEKITGVGPIIAQRIIDYRQSNGPFQTIEDIKKVNGIGNKTFEKMKNEIAI